MDGCSVNHKLYIVCNIGSALSVKNTCTLLRKRIRKGALLGIRTGYLELLTQKDLSKSAHADSANTDKVNMKRFMKVYLIHINLLIKWMWQLPIMRKLRFYFHLLYPEPWKMKSISFFLYKISKSNKPNSNAVEKTCTITIKKVKWDQKNCNKCSLNRRSMV